MFHRYKMFVERSTRFANKLYFHIFFTRRPRPGEYCNSRLIRLNETRQPAERRPYLAIIRCESGHSLRDDASKRNFDIALNCYAKPDAICSNHYEYLYAGGINKYKAAFQFLNKAHLNKYEGFILLDDDVEITYSNLSQFLTYCSTHRFGLAQPSLTRDSVFSHEHVVNASRSGWRSVHMIEVMCPYFSASALRIALRTFDLSYSTWGLDYVWPRLFDFSPVVVDEFTVRHARAVGESGFYQYMRRIGISPRWELAELKEISIEKVRGPKIG